MCVCVFVYVCVHVCVCVCVYVFMCVCDRNAIVNPIDFLLNFTAHGVCVENVLTWSLNRPTGSVVHAPLLEPFYLMGAALE